MNFPIFKEEYISVYTTQGRRDASTAPVYFGHATGVLTDSLGGWGSCKFSRQYGFTIVGYRPFVLTRGREMLAQAREDMRIYQEELDRFVKEWLK